MITYEFDRFDYIDGDIMIPSKCYFIVILSSRLHLTKQQR